METITVELPNSTRAELERLAGVIGTTPQAAMVDAINAWLAHTRAVYENPPDLSDWTC